MVYGRVTIQVCNVNVMVVMVCNVMVCMGDHDRENYSVSVVTFKYHKALASQRLSNSLIA